MRRVCCFSRVCDWRVLAALVRAGPEIFSFPTSTPTAAPNAAATATAPRMAPVAASALTALLVSVHVARKAYDSPIHPLTLSHAAVVRGEHYRLLTAAMVHGSWFHLALNVTALWFLHLERLDPLLLVRALTIGGLAAGVGAVLLWGAYERAWGRSWRYVEAVGFSGVLYVLLVVVSWRRHSQKLWKSGSTVPPRLMPLIVLGVNTALVPGASFTMHSAGVAAGYAFCVSDPVFVWLFSPYVVLQCALWGTVWGVAALHAARPDITASFLSVSMVESVRTASVPSERTPLLRASSQPWQSYV